MGPTRLRQRAVVPHLRPLLGGILLAGCASLLFAAAINGPDAELRQESDVPPLIMETNEALQRAEAGPQMFPQPVMPWHLWRISLGNRVQGQNVSHQIVFQFVDAGLRVEMDVAHADSGEWRMQPLPVLPLPKSQLGELPIHALRYGPASAARIVEQHGPGCLQPGEGLNADLIWTIYCRNQSGAIFGSIVDGETGAYQTPPPRLPAPLPTPAFIPPRALPPLPHSNSSELSSA